MSQERLELDHVLLAVADLEAAGREIEAWYGLTSIEGGRHPGWGTANRIVPLGETYLELITVVDEAEAAQSAFGRWVAEALPAEMRPLGWAVRTDDLDAVASRLSLAVSANSRSTSSGQLLRWRVAGIEEAVAEPSLPILIEWGAGTPVPGRTSITHPAGDAEVTNLLLTGDEQRIASWLGTEDLPIEARPGTPALASVTLNTPADEFVISR
jgi:Glyoxalase-like domain